MGDSPSKLTGTSWHTEFVTMKPWDYRRDKRRCIYYGENNSCNNNTRCIGSSHCDNYKEKPQDHTSGEFNSAIKIEKNKTIKPKVLDSIPCTIPIATYIETKNKKMGILVTYKNKIITLLINGKECKYPYPEAFQNGHLISTPEIEECIKKDILKAVWK